MRGLEAGGVDLRDQADCDCRMHARIKVHLANARLTQSARAALDVSGRYLFAVDHRGRIIWATPQAEKLARARGADEKFELPEPWLDWLGQMHRGMAESKSPPAISFRDEKLRLQYMGRLGANEFLLRLARDSGSDSPAEFSKELGLTSREGEVLCVAEQGQDQPRHRADPGPQPAHRRQAS